MPFIRKFMYRAKCKKRKKNMILVHPNPVSGTPCLIVPYGSLLPRSQLSGSIRNMKPQMPDSEPAYISPCNSSVRLLQVPNSRTVSKTLAPQDPEATKLKTLGCGRATLKSRALLHGSWVDFRWTNCEEIRVDAQPQCNPILGV